MVMWELESQLWAAEFLSPLKLSKVGKDYESAVEGRDCFLNEVRKDKKDGMNLSGYW